MEYLPSEKMREVSWLKREVQVQQINKLEELKSSVGSEHRQEGIRNPFGTLRS